MCDLEPHECSNCWYVGLLDPHGRCSSCGSEAVLSVHAVDVLSHMRTGIEKYFSELKPAELTA